ncbi:MAG: hypothetical protein N2Z40_00450 [Caldimicrobium sp.]|nr:hypothetical protein [Caldimicrobium sp.]MCX7612682.1 hypothetical protein [Caldimicrobium sp.]MDW8182164.1 hypothetical protein [Caldimicrobium sp.]
MCHIRLLLFFLFVILYFVSPLYSYEDSKEVRFNLWPLLVYSNDKEKGIKRLEIFGPFVARYHLEEENSTYVRPFYSKVQTPREDKAFFLSPLGLYRSDNETTTYKLIPLVNRRIEKVPSEDKVGSKWEFFPVFFGKTADNKTYGGIFPIYGKFRERFGREEISFFLWPIYSRVTYEEYTAYNILWPIGRFAKANDPKEEALYGGFKIWPFYGHFREGAEERKFVLWPFYIRNTYKDDIGNFEEKFWIFPFYGKEKTESYEKVVYIWPFYQRVCAQDPFYEQVDAPWPFYRHIKGEKIHGKRFWPLYGYVKKEESFDSFILWPLYFYKEDNFSKGNHTYLEIEHRFLLLSKFNKILKRDRLIQQELRLWPIYFNFENQETQIRADYFPAILPLYDEGMERNYGALLKIIENYQKADYRLIKILWGLYRYEKKGQREVQELAFILRSVKDENTSYVEFFEGLFGFGKIDKHPVFKIFFMNILPRREGNLNVSKDSHLSGDL